jgi:hypothetical protein
MLKINAVDLKGFKVVLERGKERYEIATLDSVVPTDAKNDLKLHLVQGNKWSGDLIADLPENRVLCIKGSIYSRNSASSTNPVLKVGSVG